MGKHAERIEVRLWIDRNEIDVFDAVATAKGVDRDAVIAAALRAYAQRKMYEATLVERVARDQESALESSETLPVLATLNTR
jgi:hypothetical protein